MSFLPLTTNLRILFITCIIASGIMVADSIIVTLFIRGIKEPSIATNSFIFAAFVGAFVFITYLLLTFVNTVRLQGYKSVKILKKLMLIITASQVLLYGILGIILIQVFTLSHYDLYLSILTVYVSHISALIMIGFLIGRFIFWLNSNRNYLILMYTVAFIIIFITLLMSLIYLSIIDASHQPFVLKKSIKRAILESSNTSFGIINLSTAYDRLTIISFASIWLPTVILLREYSRKLGPILYWILMTVPLVYFIFPFLVDEFELLKLSSLTQNSNFRIIYAIFFSPYKQVGGLLFGLAFWTSTTVIKRDRVKIALALSGFGMILLFGSNTVQGLGTIIFPPFGLVTISFMSIASYLLSFGIITSSINLARDSSIRKELYHITEKNLDLLNSLGNAEMQREIEKKFKSVKDQVETNEGSILQNDMDHEELKDLINDILREVNKGKKIDNTK